jgi:hypothetical protein
MQNRDARVAGLLYLLAIVLGWFDLMYIPDRFSRPGDAAATAHAIVANESLFRVGMVSDLVTGVVWLFVVLALYQLLKDVDRLQAALMVILGAFLQVPIYFVNVANYAAALLFASGTNFLSVFSGPQRDAMALLFMRLHHYEILASLMFAGLWLFPFGVLVYKSHFLPRFIGVWLVLDGFAWLAICFTGFLAPQYGNTVDAITRPFTLAEIAITLWLILVGTRSTRTAPPSPAAPASLGIR